MAIITKKEEGTFLLLFNRDGYVLNFTNNTFDVFTTASIGERVLILQMYFIWQDLLRAGVEVLKKYVKHIKQMICQCQSLL